MKTGSTARPNSIRKISWIWISGIAFLLCFAAAVCLILFGKRLESLGLTGNIYYIVLIPLGFSSAAFLAGAMKSYATFKSGESIRYGKLSLAGPIVIFALVVGGGFIMPTLNKKSQFDLKMRIVNQNKPMTELNQGEVILYVGMESKTVRIHDGEAMFYNIPETYNNKEVRIRPVISNYDLDGPDNIVISRNKGYIDINVARTEQSLSTRVRGSVMNEKNAPVQNAVINFGSGSATGYTDNNGDFSVTVPLPPGEKARLRILVGGVTRFNEEVTLSSTIPMQLKIEGKP